LAGAGPDGKGWTLMKFARIVFALAGIWGLLVLPPLYYRAPADTRPEDYFGFLAVALAWQIAFLVIATNPVRFRPLMPAAMLEKFIYVGTIAALVYQERVTGTVVFGAAADFVLGCLFVMAFFRARAVPPAPPDAPLIDSV
jgi:hypothetical protein